MKAFQIIKKILKYAVYACILFIFLFFFWRIYVSRHDPKGSNQVMWDNEAAEAYRQNPGQFQIFCQKTPDSISGNGYFMTSRILYLPSVNQLQVTVKFNQSTLRYFLDYYKMVPVDKEPFRLSLTDENGNIVSEQYSTLKDHYALYRYYRVTFYNVDLSQAESLNLNFCFNREIFNRADTQIYNYLVKTQLNAFVPKKKKTKFDNAFSSLQIYSRSISMEEYDYSKELPH